LSFSANRFRALLPRSPIVPVHLTCDLRETFCCCPVAWVLLKPPLVRLQLFLPLHTFQSARLKRAHKKPAREFFCDAKAFFSVVSFARLIVSDAILISTYCQLFCSKQIQRRKYFAACTSAKRIVSPISISSYLLTSPHPRHRVTAFD
jgi:hypothetical protein